MARYVEAVAPHLDPALVDENAAAALDGLLARLPPFTPAGFECRLGPDSNRADFQFHLGRASDLVAATKGFPEWAELATRIARCAEHDVRGMWVELDLLPGRPMPRSPSVFLRLAPDASREVSTRVASALLSGAELDQLVSSLGRIREFLPEGCEISHLGAMSGRDGVPSRFRVSRLARADAGELLRRLGAGDAARALDDATSNLASECDSYALLLDGVLGPNVGLECFVAGTDAEPWRVVLERLQRRGLAGERKARALLGWPGAQTARPGLPWPRNIALGDALLAGRALSVFVRSINHLKLVFDGPELQLAKAYLAFEHQWVSRAVLRT